MAKGKDVGQVVIYVHKRDRPGIKKLSKKRGHASVSAYIKSLIQADAAAHGDDFQLTELDTPDNRRKQYQQPA